MKRLSFSFALVMWTCCFAVNAAESPEEFLEVYRAKSKWLVEKYEHVHLSARIEERRGNIKRGTYNIEFFQDGNKIKAVRRFDSGDRLSHFDATTTVVTPEKSFILQRPPGQPEYYVGLLGDKSDKASSQAKLKVQVEGRVFRDPFNCLGKPILQYLTMKETKIIKVKEEEVAGKEMCSVATRTAPFTEDLKKGCDHIEGSFLFEPTAHWLLRKWTIKFWKENGAPDISVSCSVDYKEPIEGVPILRSVLDETRDPQGNLGGFYKADINLVEFGPVSADEFTLRGCGLKGDFEEDKPSHWLPIFLWSTAIVLLALVLIRILRRRLGGKPHAAG